MKCTTLLLLAGLSAGFAAHAADPVTEEAGATGSYAGVTVAIDPTTGRLRARPRPNRPAATAVSSRVRTADPMSIAKPGRRPWPRRAAPCAATRRRDVDERAEELMSQLSATTREDGSIMITMATPRHAAIRRDQVNKTLLACALAAATTFAAASASAATIIPVNMNTPGVGLNDPTPAAPIGGNPGTTIGEQRQIAYQFAAGLWGAVLESDVDIRVRAQFTALSCDATARARSAVAPDLRRLPHAEPAPLRRALAMRLRARTRH